MANALEILITGKDQFSPKARQAQRSAGKLKGGMASLGKTVVGVGAGFIAAQASIAGVSKLFTSTIGAAVKFEFQLAQIRALTGATRKDTDLLSTAIKEMAREMPKSPAELGAAAYFILSSGIEDAAEAVEVLEIAAKASTIGLGETEKVADALTTVINAYGLSAGDAAHVTDVMIEAVKQGKAEASAFAGVLGRVVPLASQMGITFEEVAANLATFTRLGVSAQEAATGLRAVMNALINPTDQTRETMAELGLSVEGLRKQIKEKGLLSALDSMMTATGGNEEALAKLFPNIRALTSVLGTAGVQLEDYKNILNATENATGNLEEGFGIVSDTAQFKMQRALGELNVAMLELGEHGLPIVVEIVKGLAAVAAAVVNPLSLFEEEARGLVPTLDGLTEATGVTRQNFIQMATDANRTRQEMADLGKALGMTGQEIQDAMNRAGISVVGLGLDFGYAQVTGRDFHNQLGDIANAAPITAEALEDMGKSATTALFDIEEAAGDARRALVDMFRETTAEEAGARAALDGYKFEVFALEGKVGDLTGAERTRLDLLNNELIPAEARMIEGIGLETTAYESATLARLGGFPSQDEQKRKWENQTTVVGNLDFAIRNLPSSKSIMIDVGVRLTGRELLNALLVPGATPLQHGTPSFKGGMALLGERGPELAMLPTGTRVLNAGQTAQLAMTSPAAGQPAQAPGGGGLTINIYAETLIGGEEAGEQIAELVAPHIREMMSG